MTVLYQDFVNGTVDDNPLTAGATTLTSTELSDLREVTSPDIMKITLDPDGTAEIVYVTAHTASATTATIERGKEGTTAASHAQSTVWRTAFTAKDAAGSALAEIETVTLSSAAASVSFSDIPSDYRDLMIIGRERSTRSNTSDAVKINVGNTTVDTGANYDYFVVTTGTNAQNNDAQSATYGLISVVSSPAATATTDYFGAFDVLIQDYTDTSKWRTVTSTLKASPINGTTYNNEIATVYWKDTSSAIDIVTLAPFNGPNFAAGTTFTLYGRGRS